MNQKLKLQAFIRASFKKQTKTWNEYIIWSKMSIFSVILTNCPFNIGFSQKQTMHKKHFLSLSVFFVLENPQTHSRELHSGGMSYHIHNSTTNSSWNESSVMRFDQTLKLNETWRKLARGPMRDDAADSSREKHLLMPFSPPPGPSPPPATCRWPRCVSTSSMSRGNHQTPQPPDLHQLIHMAQVSARSPAQIQTWSVVSGYWRKNAVQPGNQVVKT